MMPPRASTLLVGVWFASAASTGFPPFADRVELKRAVNQWCDDRDVVERKYGPIAQWDVSKVTSFNGLFCELEVCETYYDPPTNPNCIDFNEDISAWDTSSVTSLTYTFAGARAFNQPIGRWDTRNVVSLMSTFDAAEAFDQPLPWNTAKVASLSSTFRLATKINQPSIQGWDIRKVKTMRSTFHSAASFNQPLPWDTKNISEMKNVFAHALSFDQPLNWDISNVDRFEGAFVETPSLSDCNKAAIHASFTAQNKKFACARGSTDGHYRCSVGHDVYKDDCDGCGGYSDWGTYDLCAAPPPAPPYRPPTWLDLHGPLLLGVIGGVLVLLVLAVLGRAWLMRRRRQREARSSQLREEAVRISAAYDASVKSAVLRLPLSSLGTVTPSGSSDMSAGSSSWASNLIGLISPTPSEAEAESKIKAARLTAKVAQDPERVRDHVREECPICLGAFEDGQDVRDLPCRHSFHQTCIDDWLLIKGRPPPKRDQVVRGLATCPMCKSCPIEVPAPPPVGRHRPASSTSTTTAGQESGGPTFAVAVGPSAVVQST